MSKELIGLLDGRDAGRVVQDSRGQIDLYLQRSVAYGGRRLPHIDLHASCSGRARQCENRSPIFADCFRTTKLSSTIGGVNFMSRRGMCSGSSLVSVKIARVQSSSSRQKDSKQFSEMQRHPSNGSTRRSEEHTSELQSRGHLVCRLLLE